MQGNRVLITGGAGFIGSHIADALIDMNDVSILDDFSAGAREHVPPGATILEGDIRDEDTLQTATQEVDVVFHEAGQVSVAQSVTAPVDSHSINVDGTLAVLQAAHEANARTILASSAAVYGSPDRIPITEDHAVAPRSPYGIDKLAIDHYARAFDRLYDQDVVALRYFNVYGPRGGTGDYSGVISAFFEQAHTGGPITVHGEGTQTRDFVHVDDVVQANLLAAQTDATGEAYNVATGSSVTIRELAELVKQVTDSDADIIHTDSREGDIDRSRASIEKARNLLGFHPDVSLQDGLAQLSEQAGDHLKN